MGYLILIRHGESEWNAKGLWTGWTDIHLSEKGREEARKAAILIKDFQIDRAFVSALVRSQETLDEIESVLHIHPPTESSSALNERNYGDFTGKNKWDIEKEYGEEQFLKWRRGWDEPIPHGETLKDVYERVIPYYKEHILPFLEKGETVLISAHGNSLRALMKYLENISDEDISHVELATGEIIIYQISDIGEVISKERKIGEEN